MDQYEDLNLVGRGLFSQVYRAKNKANGAVVAIKITCPDDEVAPHDSLREVKIVSLLSQELKHTKDESRIIEFLDSFTRGKDELELVMVMPFMPFDLVQLLKHSRKADFPSGWKNSLDPVKAIEIVLKIGQALVFVHSRGVIHRDIKPHNILFKSLDTNPYLCDFGISWKAPDNFGLEPPDQKITDVGTTVYRAPELLFGRTAYSSAIDIWSLGCIACQLMSKNGDALFEPYNGDISLLGSQFKLLGTPSVESWPTMKDSETFHGLLFEQHEKKPWKELAPRAPQWFHSVLENILVYEETWRLSAEKLCMSIEESVNNDAHAS